MKSNKIEGIKPFNKFFFRSCYYHQLIAGLASFGISYEDIIVSFCSFAKEDFEVKNCLISEKKLGKCLGYSRSKIRLTKKSLIKSIDKNCPIIAGVDCYYYKNRLDSYKKRHILHFVLIYGYDEENGTIEIIDHAFRNSNQYNKETIFMEDLLYANKKLRQPPLRKQNKCIVLKKKAIVHKINIFRKIFSDEKIKEGNYNAIKNLENLKQLICGETEILENKTEKVLDYLNEIKNTYLKFSVMTVFEKEDDFIFSELVNGYSNLIAILLRVKRKKDYEFVKKNIDRIVNKIDKIIETEKLLDIIILEKIKCLIKK